MWRGATSTAYLQYMSDLDLRLSKTVMSTPSCRFAGAIDLAGELMRSIGPSHDEASSSRVDLLEMSLVEPGSMSDSNARRVADGGL